MSKGLQGQLLAWLGILAQNLGMAKMGGNPLDTVCRESTIHVSKSALSMLHGCREITPQTTPFVGRLSQAWTLAFPTAIGAWHIPSVTFYSLICSMILRCLELALVQLEDALLMKAREDASLCRKDCRGDCWTGQINCNPGQLVPALLHELESRQALGWKTRESIAMLALISPEEHAYTQVFY